MRGLNLPVVRFSAIGKGNAPAASNAAPAGVFGALSVKLSVNQFVRQPGLGTIPDTLSASSGIHPFDGQGGGHPKIGFCGMEQICAMIQKVDHHASGASSTKNL